MRHLRLVVLSMYLTLPMTFFGQALIKNYEYISFFNPATSGLVDKLAVTAVHNYYDFNGNVMNSSLGGLEFELPKINSGFVLNFDLIRDDRRNYAYVQQSEIQNLNLNLGYRYRFEIKEDFGVSLGIGLRHMSRKVYRRWTGFLSPGYTEEWEGQTWSMNAGLFVDWKNWGLGFSINDLLEPNLKNSMGIVMQSELITRAYNVQLYHNLEYSEKFSLRPQFYFGQVSSQPLKT